MVERTYRARVEELCELWTTKEGFESWWGPEGCRSEVHTIEARVGGTLHYNMIAVEPAQIAEMKQMGWGTSQVGARPIHRDQTEPAADHHACHGLRTRREILRVHDRGRVLSGRRERAHGRHGPADA